MKSLFRSPVALFYALLVHAVLIGVLVFSFDWSREEDTSKKVKVVQAVTVDESKVKKQIENLKKKEARKRREEDARQRKLKKQADDAKKARLREEQRLADAKKKHQREKQKIKEQEQKRKVEEKRVAALKKKREVEQKKRKQLEIKRKREEAKLNKARQEQKRIAEQKRIKEDLEQKRREAEQLLLDQMIADEEAQVKKQLETEKQLALAQQEQAKNASIIDEYRILIRGKIENNWNIPLQFRNSKEETKCEVNVQLIPGGDVKHAEAVSGKCDPALKNSIETAVYKAAPLPLPPDPGLFDNFREINLIVIPPVKK